MCIGLADVITDGIVLSRLLGGRISVPDEGYTPAYTVILCFGVVTTALSLAYRLRNARMVRVQVLEMGKHAKDMASFTGTQRQAQQQEFELAQTHRTKVVLSLGLLSIAVQGTLPMLSNWS